MTPEQYQQMQEIFLRACDLPPAERAAFVAHTCGGNAELAAGVNRLLEHDRQPLTLTQNAEIRARIEGVFDTLSDSPTATAEPTLIGRYRIIRLIGVGGMGRVYEAEQDHPRRRVALKLMRGGLPGQPSANLQRRFHQEANALAKLQHPGIAQIYDAGVAHVESADLPFFAMELVSGAPLGVYADAHHLDVRARLALLADIAEAAHYAHTRGVIHRDLKPANILVDESGQPRILDFGVARITDSDTRAATRHTDVGQIIGTLAYMSPEQVAGAAHSIDPRSDVYALGVILYELLSGVKPLDLDSKSFVQAVRAIQELEPARLSHGKLWDGRPARALRGDVETIVAKALQKDRNQRYSSAAQFADDLRRHLNDEPIAARPATALYQLRKFARRNRAVAAGIAIAAAALIVGSVVTTYLALSETRLRHLADENAKMAATNEQRATTGEIAARRNAYRLGIAAAQATLDDPAQARRHLADAPVEYRNWEWRYLSNRVDPAVARQTADAGAIPAGQFTAAGHPLAALVRNGVLQVLQVDTGEQLAATPLPPGTQIRDISLRPDGSRVGWFDPHSNSVMLWDPPAAPRRLSVAVQDFVSLSFDAMLARAGLLSRNDLNVIELDSERSVLHTRLDPLEAGIRVMLADDGALVAVDCFVEGPRVVSIRDVGAGVVVAKYITSAPIAGLAFDLARRRMLLADTFHRLFSIPVNGEPSAQLGPSPNSGPMLDMRLSPSGRYLGISGADERVFLVDPESLAPHVVGGIAARAVTIADDGRLLAAADGLMQLYAPRPESPLAGHTSFVYCVAASPDGARLASAAWDGTVRVWDARTGAPLKTLDAVASATEPLGVWFSADGALLHAEFNGAPRFKAWRTADFKPLPDRDSDDFEAGVHFVRGSFGHRKAISYDGKWVVEGTGSVVELRDLATGAVAKSFHPSDQIASAVELSHNNARLAVATIDGIITIYDVDSDREIVHRQAHANKVYSLAFTSDDTRLASGGDDSVIEISDAATLEPRLTLRGHTSYVHALAFTANDRALISGSGDMTVRLWPAP